jgi:hypothetical protein
MRGVRVCAAIAAWIAILLAMSGCSVFEDLLEPPPLATAFNPLPPPAEPPPAPPESAESAYPPPPGTARAEMTQWLSTHGYQQFQIAALMQHAQVESGFQACAAGPGGYRYLFQWGGTRLQRLQKFAKHSGCPQMKTQLAFADDELRNDPKFTCFWNAATESGAYAALRRGFGRGSC